MIRKPTPIEPLYTWHRDALAGRKPVITHEAHCGWFKRRLVKGGPHVPARIWLHQEIDPDTGELIGPESLKCEVGGKERDPVDQWTYLAGNPISEADYRYLMSLISWARDHSPAHPASDESKPIDFNSSPIPF